MRKQEHSKRIKREWIAKLADGTQVREKNGVLWSDIADKVVWLGINTGNQLVISLPTEQKRYLQGKTGSCCITGGKIVIESRWIGFETNNGSTIITRIMEEDGSIEVEVS